MTCQTPRQQVIMLLRHRKTLPTLRALALLLVCFQVLASSRGLVPSICLTLRDGGTATAAVQESSCCTVQETPSCCEPKPGHAPAKPAGKESPHCAFCFLAKAYTEAPVFFQYPHWRELADAPYVRGPGAHHERPADDRTLGRAPPFHKA